MALAKKMLVCNQEMVERALETLPSQKSLEKLGEFFKALTDATRLKILYALDSGELCVCDLAAIIGASVSSTSHHLAPLKRARLVHGRREGRIIYYALDDEHIKTIVKYAHEHLGETV